MVFVDDQKAMRTWLMDYDTWLTTSKTDEVRAIAEVFKTKRIVEQIQPDAP